MKPVLLFVDDDTNILDAIPPNIRRFVDGRVKRVLEMQSVDELTDFLANPGDHFPIVAIVDLWFNNMDNNTADQEAGIRAIKAVLDLFPKTFVIVFSAHLNSDRIQRISAMFPGVRILSKGEGGIDSLQSEIDVGLKSRGF